jgi:hypothetical protein
MIICHGRGLGGSPPTDTIVVHSSDQKHTRESAFQSPDSNVSIGVRGPPLHCECDCSVCPEEKNLSAMAPEHRPVNTSQRKEENRKEETR